MSLSNGGVDSSTSTVSLTISPVNDVAVVADVAGIDRTLNEGSTLTLDLLIHADGSVNLLSS